MDEPAEVGGVLPLAGMRTSGFADQAPGALDAWRRARRVADMAAHRGATP